MYLGVSSWIGVFDNPPPHTHTQDKEAATQDAAAMGIHAAEDAAGSAAVDEVPPQQVQEIVHEGQALDTGLFLVCVCVSGYVCVCA